MHEVVGKQCKLLKPIRDPQGKLRYREEINPTIKRVINNLDRLMYEIVLSDGVQMILFPREVEIINGEDN